MSAYGRDVERVSNSTANQDETLDSNGEGNTISVCHWQIGEARIRTSGSGAPAALKDEVAWVRQEFRKLKYGAACDLSKGYLFYLTESDAFNVEEKLEALEGLPLVVIVKGNVT